MTKPKILLLGHIDHAKEEWASLADLGELVEAKSTARAGFIQECKDGLLDGVVAAYRTFNSISMTGMIDEELITHLPKSLKFIAHNGWNFSRAAPLVCDDADAVSGSGAGYDQIDVHACTAHDIRVANVPIAVDDATADANMFLILGALRGFNSSMFAAREGKWRGSPAPPLGHDPQGKVLGILGMGGIGRNLMKKAAAFGMTTQYYNRTKLSEELSGGAKYVNFDELLATSDVLSLNLPLNKNTRHIIGPAEFQKMKRGVVVVNTARGAVIDEAALVEALASGQVWSCGLDVFEEEPRIHPGLLENRSVMLLPHMGTWTVETQTKMEVWCIENVRMALTQGRLKSPVVEQKDL
ncbi:MAG: hypothetical protein M1818_007491 [Claussenomyces sp. TS43310]|nr:MAG: hypothetical protein M1818_007491 [Claussenomyces sp. TS43310]